MIAQTIALEGSSAGGFLSGISFATRTGMTLPLRPPHSTGSRGRSVGCVLAIVLASAIGAVSLSGQIVDPFYAGTYTATTLGDVPGLPTPYGGLTLLAGSTDTLLIGGAANAPSGGIYSIGVTRDAGGHISGFLGSATLFSAAPNIDGGLTYGPGGVLFYTGYPINTLGQIEPGSMVPDKVTSLAPLGVGGSVGSVAFVPGGHPGAGQAKLVSFSTGQWYTLGLSADGTGTFNVDSATLNTTIPGGPEGIAYVPLGSALFPNPSVLVAEYSAGMVAAYETDANGNPIVGTRTTFLSALSGAEGAFIDPVTGDFLFSTFGGGNDVVRVSGFVAPPPPPTGRVPDAGSTAVMLVLSLGVITAARRRRL